MAEVTRADTGRRRWLMLGLAMAAQATTCMYLFGIAYLLPELRDAFSVTLAQATLLVVAPGVGLMATLILWGAVADRYGERLAMSIGLGGAGVLVAAVPLVDSVTAVGVLLMTAGAAGAAVNAGSGRIILGWFPANRRGVAMGARQMALPIGLALAAATLPPLAERYGFGRALLLPAFSALAVALLVAVFVTDPPRPDTDVTTPAGSPYRTMPIWRVHASSGLLVVPQLVVATFALVYLVDEYGWPPARAGALLAVVQIAGASTRLLAGLWSDRVASRLRPMRLLAYVNAATMAGLAVAALAGSSVAVAALVVCAVITVSGNGLAFTAVAELAGRAWAGRALGAQNTVQGVAATVTAPAFAVVITQTSYSAAYALAAVFPLLAAAVIPVAAEGAAGLAAESSG
ncbi:MAG TPA: MFS transporter [Jiangellaceae bacterium]|nr:MFS transporter [Jiangellaceae bacterium]